ncbi:unnamed protein product [Calypogeia fissa]
MRGLQTIQLGRQWCSKTTADAAGLDYRWNNATHFVKVGKTRCNVTSSSQQTATEKGLEDGVNQEKKGEEMVSVQFRGNEIKVPKGEVLRTALLQHGLSPHNEGAVVINCRGAGTCGTCAVQIEGSVKPETWGMQETVRLNFPPHRPPQNSNLRLACQVLLDGHVKLTKYDKFWGQGSIPKGHTSVSDSVTPLGDVEYVFDVFKKSKST